MTGPSRHNVPRRCIATGQTVGKARLVRFVLAPDGEVVPDLAERLPGRGVWVSARREAVERARARGGFSRGFRRPVRIDSGLADSIERQLARRVVDLLALARRAGEAVAGFEKCRAGLGRPGTVLLHARDGSLAGLGKLAGRGADEAIRVLDGAELGRPFGREGAVHVALSQGRLATKIVQECSRLSGFRTVTGGSEEGR